MFVCMFLFVVYLLLFLFYGGGGVVVFVCFVLFGFLLVRVCIVRHFGEYFGVNCGFLATSMKFSPMIEFDLMKKILWGHMKQNPI